jgi:3-oxoacyl-(acyl-carrier-protein) synthase
MRRLVDHPEHLDGALADRVVLKGNLRDLARINRRFGGTRLSTSFGFGGLNAALVFGSVADA